MGDDGDSWLADTLGFDANAIRSAATAVAETAAAATSEVVGAATNLASAEIAAVPAAVQVVAEAAPVVAQTVASVAPSLADDAKPAFPFPAPFGGDAPPPGPTFPFPSPFNMPLPSPAPSGDSTDTPPPAPADSGPPADPALAFQYYLERQDWMAAAEALNGLSEGDIQARLSGLSPVEIANLHRGAVGNSRVGPDSAAARLTAPNVAPGTGPAADDPNKDDPLGIPDGLKGVLTTITGAVATPLGKVGELIETPDGFDRPLNGGEISTAQAVYAASIDYSKVRVIGGSLMAEQADARTVGNDIYMNTRFVVAGSSATDWTLNDEGVETLMHELAHVWQFQHQGWGYVPAALWAQELGDAIGKDAYDWKSLANRHVPWEKWNPEAQARAAEDYNKLLQAGRSGTLSPDEYQMLQLLSAYTDKMAAGPQTS